VPKVQNVGKSLPFVLENLYVIKYAYFDGIAHELLLFSSHKLLVRHGGNRATI